MSKLIQRAVLISIVRTTFITLLTSACFFNVSALAQDASGVASDAVSDKGARYKRGELLVKFKAHIAEQRSTTIGETYGVAQVKAFRRPRKLSSSPIDQWRLIKLKPGIETKQALENFAQDPDVEAVEYNFVFTADIFPDDSKFAEQWALHNTGQTGGTLDADIDAPEAWDTQTGSSDVVVAVIDSGVDYNHEDLADNIWTNPGEIADNDIDDDGNGFIDDVHGWDFANDDNDPFDNRG
ncbi:S8 family serine peptidase, partial [Kaarinaea lacus]